MFLQTIRQFYMLMSQNMQSALVLEHITSLWDQLLHYAIGALYQGALSRLENCGNLFVNVLETAQESLFSGKTSILLFVMVPNFTLRLGMPWTYTVVGYQW